MFKCRQLSKLPKLNGKPSVVFRGCKPGALTGAFPITDRYAVRLDPKHPALRVNLKILPLVSQPFLSIKAIPFGILTKPENAVTFERPVELWESRVARLNAERPDASNISLPVHLLMPKKTVHKKKYLRVEIARKVKTAIALIFSRGLDVGSDGGLVLNDRQTREDCDKLIVDGWSYVISPQLEIYRMPFEDLIKGLRKSLLRISSSIRQLEQQWATKDKHVYSDRAEARFTSARPKNPTLAEMRAKMRENEERRRRDAENELQRDDPLTDKTAVLKALNDETFTSNVSSSSNPSYSLPDRPLEESRQYVASNSFVSATTDSFNNEDSESMPARMLERDDNASIVPSLRKKDNFSWISFLDDVVEDAEKDILFAPIEDEEEPDMQNDHRQKIHRYASRWDGFHTNHVLHPARRDDSSPENPVKRSPLPRRLPISNADEPSPLRPVLDKAWHSLTRRIPLPEKAWSHEEQRYIPHPKRQAKIKEEEKPPTPSAPPPSDGMSALDRAKAMVDSKKRIMIVPPPRPRRK